MLTGSRYSRIQRVKSAMARRSGPLSRHRDPQQKRALDKEKKKYAAAI